MPPLPKLDGVQHRFVDLDGVRLHVAEAGPKGGEPIVLLHGWLQHWWCWRKTLPLLSERYRCVIPDLRGHGWSEATDYGYEKEALAEDVIGLLDALEVDRVYFIGHDWGAWIGLLLAMRYPDRIRGLLALSIVHPWPSLRDRLNPLRLAAFGYQLPLSTPIVGERLMRAGLTRRVLSAGSTNGTFSEQDLRLYDAAMGSPGGARVTVSLYRTFLLRELPAIVAGRYRSARLDVPVQLIVGENEPLARGADLGGYESHAPRMSVERVANAAHFLPEERPQLVAARAAGMFA